MASSKRERDQEDGAEPAGEASRLLSRAAAGDEKAASRLLPLVYDELRRLAGGYLRRERPGQTLQATALVHEAYMRLVKPGDQPWRAAHIPRLPPCRCGRCSWTGRGAVMPSSVARASTLDGLLPAPARRRRGLVALDRASRRHSIRSRRAS
jgi:hypothetical protein